MTVENAIPQLVFKFFQLLGKKPVEIRKGIWQVHLDEALAKELDGWRAKERLFQFTFDRKLADTYGAEFISPGSYRLDTILQAIRKQAALSRAHLPHELFHEPSIRRSVEDRLLQKAAASVRYYALNLDNGFAPYLWLISQVSYITHQRRDELVSHCVNLCTGRVMVPPISNHLFVGGAPVSARIRRRRVTYKQAYKNLCQHITSELEGQDNHWAEEAWEALYREEEKLAQFFEGSPDEELEAKRRILRENHAPRVLVRPIRGALLYVPNFTYRLMEVGLTERVMQITYDPLTHEISDSVDVQAAHMQPAKSDPLP